MLDSKKRWNCHRGCYFIGIPQSHYSKNVTLSFFNSVWIKSMVMGDACVSPTSREQPVSFVKKTTNLARSVIKVSVTKT